MRTELAPHRVKDRTDECIPSDNWSGGGSSIVEMPFDLVYCIEVNSCFNYAIPQHDWHHDYRHRLTADIASSEFGTPLVDPSLLSTGIRGAVAVE